MLKYLVHWEGFGPEDDTSEPIEHLAGAEEYISHFVEERNAATKRSEEENELRYVNVQSSNHLNLLMMYMGDLVLSLENLRLLNVKLHGSGKLLPISLLAMINRSLGTNVCYPCSTMVQNVILYNVIVEIQLIWQPISEQGTANMSLSINA